MSPKPSLERTWLLGGGTEVQENPNMTPKDGSSLSCPPPTQSEVGCQPACKELSSPPSSSLPPFTPARAHLQRLSPGGEQVLSLLCSTPGVPDILPSPPLCQSPSDTGTLPHWPSSSFLPLSVLTEDVKTSWLHSLALNQTRPPHWQCLCPQEG